MVALIIIYNHKYEKNIQLLENIYKDKFSYIFHLMPFYTGDKENVLAVYDNSYYFQGYIAQAYQILKSKGEFQHYFFVGDDVLLNQEINENNYKTYFNLTEKDSFFTRFDETSQQGKWPHINRIVNFSIHQEGLEVSGELPEKEEILQKFYKYNLQKPFVYTKNIYQLPLRKNYAKGLKGYLYYKREQSRIKKLLKSEIKELEFPLVCGYSDVIIISNDDIKQFTHYCGVFSAGNLFVEAAIPTAMVIACKNIITAKDLNKDYMLLWGNEREEFEREYKLSLNYLLQNFPENILYIHPVKLSKWQKN